jgi:predicted RNA-binding Zn ribbon-like protein
VKGKNYAREVREIIAEKLKTRKNGKKLETPELKQN